MLSFTLFTCVKDHNLLETHSCHECNYIICNKKKVDDWKIKWIPTCMNITPSSFELRKHFYYFNYLYYWQCFPNISVSSRIFLQQFWENFSNFWFVLVNVFNHKTNFIKNSTEPVFNVCYICIPSPCQFCFWYWVVLNNCTSPCPNSYTHV